MSQHRSTEMVQLAERLRMASLMSADPFAKIKGMIQEMIEKLVKEAEEEAGHKAYCDKEMGETKVKKADMTEEVEDLQVRALNKEYNCQANSLKNVTRYTY